MKTVAATVSEAWTETLGSTAEAHHGGRWPFVLQHHHPHPALWTLRLLTIGSGIFSVLVGSGKAPSSGGLSVRTDSTQSRDEGSQEPRFGSLARSAGGSAPVPKAGPSCEISALLQHFTRWLLTQEPHSSLVGERTQEQIRGTGFHASLNGVPST